MNAIDPTLPERTDTARPSVISRLYDAKRHSLGAWLRAAEVLDEARTRFRESQRLRRRIAQENPMLFAREPEVARDR